jgi:dTDP-4-dehydrorhamnose reductase
VTKILISGASGLLGANLVLETMGKYDVTAVYHAQPIRASGIKAVHADLSVRDCADRVITKAEPDWVIHCAAETDVDQCELDSERAFRLNRDMARWVAQAAWTSGAQLTHISTDAVFDGSRPGYREEDSANPINVYGRSKRAGEEAVLEAHPEALIIRTNFFGWNAQNKLSLAEWFLLHLEKGKRCQGFVDVKVKLLLVNDLIKIVIGMLEHGISGIYHVLSADCTSKYEFGVRLAQMAGLDSDLIEPIEVGHMDLNAPRPRNLCLDSSKLMEALGIGSPTIEEGLRRFFQLRAAGFPGQLKSLIGG